MGQLRFLGQDGVGSDAQRHAQLIGVEVGERRRLGQDEVGDLALAHDDLLDLLVDGAGAHETVADDRLGLPDPPSPVTGLVLDGGVPPPVVEHDVAGGGQVEAGAAGLQREHQRAGPLLGLEVGDHVVAGAAAETTVVALDLDAGQGGQVLGIVSLGDVARHTDRTEIVAKSLHAISAPIGIAAPHRSGSGGPLIGLLLAALVTSVMAWLTWNRSGQTFRKQLSKTDLYHSAQHTLNTARDKVDKAASSKSVRTARRDVDAKIKTVRHDVDATLNDLAAQLPTVTYQPAKAKHGLFA